MKKFYIFFIALFLPVSGFAVTAEQIQRQQQQQLDAAQRAFEIQRLEEQSPYTKGSLSDDEKSTETDSASQNCADVKTVKFGGNTILSDSSIKKITARYENKCLTVDEINNMLGDITNKYIDLGYITSRAFMAMPQVDLNRGILNIYIIEGGVNKINGLTSAQTLTAFPWVAGDVLNIRDIEQGLDQINRLGSNNAKMEITATPQMDGVSDIVISNNPSGRVNLSADVNNYGTNSTGEWQANLTGTIDNMLGLNDMINLSLSSSLNFDMGQKASRSALLDLSIPFGYWTVSNNFSYSYFKTSFPMPLSGDLFFTLGDSWTNTTSLDRILSRGQTYKIGATISLRYKDNENRMRVHDLETINNASTRALATLNFDLPTTFYFPRGIVFIKPSVVRGLDIFGALKDDGTYQQRAQYTAARLYGYTSWNLAGVRITSAIDSQYSNDQLFSTEGFYLGGFSSIRGFRDEGVSGDSGFSIRNDIAFNIPHLLKADNVWLGRFTPGVFFDFGMTFSNSDYVDNAALSGAGVKLDFDYSVFNASISYAKTIIKEDWMNESGDIYLYLGASTRF